MTIRVKWIVWAIVWAVLCITAAASEAGAAVQTVTANDKTIVLHENGKNHSYEFDNEELQLSEIETVKLLFQNRVNKELYVLLYVVGPSTGGGNGYCGAGEEQFLIWLALDADWGKDDQKLELIASCFETIELTSSEPYAIKDGKLISQYVDFKEDEQGVESRLTYDSTKPEKAWTIERKRRASPNIQ